MLIEYRNERTREQAKERLNRYMKNHVPVIRPYGELRSHGYGYKIWGEKTVNGKKINNVYYADSRCVAKWRGNKIGWRVILKIDGRTQIEKTKKTNQANKLMQQARTKSLLSN